MSDPRLSKDEESSCAFGSQTGEGVRSERASDGSDVAKQMTDLGNNNESKKSNEVVDGNNICSGKLGKEEEERKGGKGAGQKESHSSSQVAPATEKPDCTEKTSHNQTSDATEDMADYGHEIVTLPKTFVVKYLGQEDASGLWGIKYTRKPVDEMVGKAKNLKPPATLPVVKLEVSLDGIKISNSGTAIGGKGKNVVIKEDFPIDTISYGVQDLVYTRVFAVIIVRESENVVEKHPFRCYGFVCDSRGNARRLTLALAKAFQEFSKALKSSEGDPTKKAPLMRPKKLAIDLRSAEELKKDMTEEDSEA